MSRIAVLIPSRDRPEQLKRAIQSVRDTSQQADVLVYCDDDQHELYDHIEQEENAKGDARAIFHWGSRVGPVAAANALVEANPGYGVYGLITDDSEMTSPGWDEWVLANLNLVISPRVSLGPHVDMPFVSREWIDKLGWFAYPGNYHTGWPTITGVLAEALGRIRYAPSEAFGIFHNPMPSTNQDHLREDARQLYAFFQMRFATALSTLRKTP